ncbi:MAG: adenosine deaminase [Sphingomonadales bacterium]|nr:adenosine deaminase [Sphingomonadales bacterium]
MVKNGRVLFILAIGLTGLFLAAMGAYKQGSVGGYFEKIKENPSLMQSFLRAFPKGADLHNHLAGAVYAESFIGWAASDNLCVDVKNNALKNLNPGISCSDSGWQDAKSFVNNSDAVDALVDNISMRAFVPTSGWNGHNQFFSTFGNTVRTTQRLGDMLAETQARAGVQNISYLELMTSLDLGGVYAVAFGTAWQDAWDNDIAAGYAALMAGAYGEKFEELIDAQTQVLDNMEARRDEVLACNTDTPDHACEVEVRYLYQVIRVGPSSGTFAGFIMGFEMAKRDPRVVGINLVAPEDHPQALADYDLHMNMIDLLWHEKGEIDISLHAGELALGLVMPKHMRSHIRDAIDVGHAKRIGHGMDIAYEDRPMDLLTQMRDQDVMVEINLTSNDVILGVKGDEHPILLYQLAGVPLALSTDDEGVSRIDLTHEFERAVYTYDLSYGDIKQLARNSVKYGFTSDGDKALLVEELEAKFIAFEQMVASWPTP